RDSINLDHKQPQGGGMKSWEIKRLPRHSKLRHPCTVNYYKQSLGYEKSYLDRLDRAREKQEMLLGLDEWEQMQNEREMLVDLLCEIEVKNITFDTHRNGVLHITCYSPPDYEIV